MDKRRLHKQDAKSTVNSGSEGVREKIYKRRSHKQDAKSTANSGSEEEVSSIKWEYVKMSEDEVDLIYRMYRLIGDRWHLIAGRIPGRKAEEIERFWIMAHSKTFSRKRNEPAYLTKD